MDILIYDDFIKEEFLHWNEALSLGLRTCLGACSYSSNRAEVRETLSREGCRGYLKKVEQFLQKGIKVIDLPVLGQYGYLTVCPRGSP